MPLAAQLATVFRKLRRWPEPFPPGLRQAVADEFLSGLSRASVTFLVLAAKTATSAAAREQVGEAECLSEVPRAVAVLKLEVDQVLPIICEFGLRPIPSARGVLA